MLTKLSPDQLSEAWPLVQRAVRSSSLYLADMSEERINDVLRSLMIGQASCWIHERSNAITTVVITTIVEEPLSRSLSLLIYCAHMFAKVSSDDYIQMAKDIGAYAKTLNCSRVMLYCSNEKLTELLKKNGAADLYSLVVFSLL